MEEGHLGGGVFADLWWEWAKYGDVEESAPCSANQSVAIAYVADVAIFH